MNRSLLIGIIATIALFSGIAIYFYLNNIKIKNRPAIEGVPDDAFIILQSKEITKSLSLLGKSSLWADLIANPSVSKLNKQLEETINIISNDEELNEILEENTTAISLHNNSNKLGLLAIVETGKPIELSDITNYLSKKINAKAIKRSFDKTPVYDFNDAQGNALFSISYRDQLLLCAADASLVEESIRKLKYNLANPTKGLNQAYLMSETSADLNLFINYQKLPLLGNLFTKSEYYNILSYIKGFANWSMLDVELNDDIFKLSGVTFTDDSVFQFLDLFKNQTPKQLQLHKYMPKNTAMAFQMGFSDYMKFNTELNEYLQVHKKGDLYARFSDSIENRYDIDISQNIINYIDGEASLVMVEPAGSDFYNNLNAFIRFKDPVGMANALKNIIQAMNRKGEIDSVTYYHQGLEIERIKLGNFLKLYYGEIMENIFSPYYVQLDDVFVFANDINTLKYIIDQYKLGNTLANDESFKTYQNSLAVNNNVSIFISPARNFLLPTNFVNDSFFSSLNTYQYDFKKFEFFSIQFSNTNNKAFYTQVSYKYNNVNTNETQLLWASKLDTIFDIAPQVVYNSELKQNVIFVQDINNTLYCINTNGNLIWRSKLNGKLVGNFHVIDPQKNGTSCYLFSTDKQANLIDAKGISLYNYPIRYPGKALLPLTLADFYDDSTLQFFVALENNRIVGYALNGKPLQGWMPKVLESKANAPIGLIKKGLKRFVYTTNIKGQLCLFDNKGKAVKLKHTNTAILFEYVSNIDTVQLKFNMFDSSGIIKQITFDSLYNPIGEPEDIAQFEPFTKIIVQNDQVTNNTFILTQTKNSWSLYGPDLKKIISKIYTDSIPQYNYFTSDAVGKVMLSNFQKQLSEYYWYNMKGELYIDFPIKGNSPFNTANLMMDRRNYLIGGDQLNNIFVYKLK
jgi:hypothetical protein